MSGAWQRRRKYFRSRLDPLRTIKAFLFRGGGVEASVSAANLRPASKLHLVEERGRLEQGGSDDFLQVGRIFRVVIHGGT